jgi:hypothetical protein
MHRHIYDVISTNEHRTYTFLSEGPKGTIKKVINFEEIDDDLFNLSFGDWDEAVRDINDKVRSNNHDRDKVLATIAATVMIFIKYYPNAIVFAKGSTPARTRLYQMGIFANWQEISILLTIKGFIDGDWQPIEKCRNYDGFMAKIK